MANTYINIVTKFSSVIPLTKYDSLPVHGHKNNSSSREQFLIAQIVLHREFIKQMLN